MFKKILIANRGEIAVRIIRACRELGIRTVAVYSEADRRALHVRLADEAVLIGPSPPVESYLNMEALLDAARKTGAEAIHPGYGFLAENPVFARRCGEAGLVFIGPSPEAIEVLGNKITARRLMERIGVPVVPGGVLSKGDPLEASKVAEKLGYPVLIKAAAGGGGRGMRVVRTPSELPDLLASARREAEAAFGDGTVFLEKYLPRPRHVEVQILADSHGGVVHLGERECSIQRRYQKLLEETPSPAVNARLRRRIGEAAIEAARAATYVNAGTIEFLLDQEGRFYFLEVNARLQVEHPITELCTGIDLVKAQIRIAAGKPLGFQQRMVHPRGHAIECRIYAEDPSCDFLPSPGRIVALEEPSGPGIRVDSGVYVGLEVSPFYDPLLAKVSVWAEDREAARRRMVEALNAYTILGVTTCREFLSDVLNHPAFIAGKTHTHFIAEHFTGWKGRDREHRGGVLVTGAGEASHRPREESGLGERGSAGKLLSSPWETLGRWRLGEYGAKTFVATSLETSPPRALRPLMGRAPLEVRSSMPGKILKLSVAEGDLIGVGQELLVLEAMKMEHVIRSEREGRIKKVHVVVGERVEPGQLLVEFEAEET